MKEIFIRLDLHEHFNILKLHLLLHYVEMIKNLGSFDGFNTENSECLHIDYAKKAYAASSRKDYTIQMTRWLQCQEAVIWFNRYLQGSLTLHSLVIPSTTMMCNKPTQSTQQCMHELPPLMYAIVFRDLCGYTPGYQWSYPHPHP